MSSFEDFGLYLKKKQYNFNEKQENNIKIYEINDVNAGLIKCVFKDSEFIISKCIIQPKEVAIDDRGKQDSYFLRRCWPILRTGIKLSYKDRRVYMFYRIPYVSGRIPLSVIIMSFEVFSKEVVDNKEKFVERFCKKDYGGIYCDN